MNEQAPLPLFTAVAGEIRCIGSTARLLTARRIHLPSGHVGMRLRFGNGTSARVYRETVVEGARWSEPAILAVEFRLRWLRGRWHAAFRWESLLNTPLFVGFPGFVSKLWLTHDERNTYRGIYDWDGAERAEHYARSLWRVLALACDPASIHYIVLPGLRRDDLLAAPEAVDASASATGDWWRPVAAT
jgi:hypothetical protein